MHACVMAVSYLDGKKRKKNDLWDGLDCVEFVFVYFYYLKTIVMV